MSVTDTLATSGAGARTSRFAYILDRIADAPFSDDPFRHVYIEDLFSPDDFADIISLPEINIAPAETDEQLFELLHTHGFQAINFPGSITNIERYIKWRKDPTSEKIPDPDLCEGFGVTLRLQKSAEGSLLRQLGEFFTSDDFWQSFASKFNVRLEQVRTDSGLQKYLDGYEISPHPDKRMKALTFMINMNPAANSEELEYHTHYLKFKPEWRYIQDFWEQNPDVDTCWVPWRFCTTSKQQTKNNSAVFLAPGTNTMHAVKASYNHLLTQRTQYYGNLWFTPPPVTTKRRWTEYTQGAE